jgi:alkylated DNA repair dioxygenase AlkB
MASKVMTRNTNIDTDLKPPNTKHLMGASSIIEYPNFWSRDCADKILTRLLSELSWRTDSIALFGKKIPIPRLQCWMGESHCNYKYSGISMAPLPWIPALEEILNKIQRNAGAQFNCVLINQYRNGLDSNGWHADDEKILGNSPIIASASFGVTRKFQLKPKSGGTGKSSTFYLSHGSLIIMNAGIQEEWLHQIPKEKQVTGTRLNLTFRYIPPAPLSDSKTE